MSKQYTPPIDMFTFDLSAIEKIINECTGEQLKTILSCDRYAHGPLMSMHTRFCGLHKSDATIDPLDICIGFNEIDENEFEHLTLNLRDFFFEDEMELQWAGGENHPEFITLANALINLGCEIIELVNKAKAEQRCK